MLYIVIRMSKIKNNRNKKNSSNKSNIKVVRRASRRMAGPTIASQSSLVRRVFAPVGPAPIVIQRKLTSNARTFPSLSQCAMKYAMAIADPFSPDATAACIPLATNRLSHKVSSFTRFDLAASVNGTAGVLFTPCLANNLASAWTFSGPWTGSSLAATLTSATTTSTVGVTPVVISNLPYTAAQLTESAQGAAGVVGRIVSYGVRVHYTGPTLNQAGLLYCYTDPSHSNLESCDVPYLGNRLETDIGNVSRDRCTLTVFPISASEAEFNSSFTPGTYTSALDHCYPLSQGSGFNSGAAAAGYVAGAAPMVVYATGMTVGTTIHVEIMVHCEYVGNLTEGKGTESHIDVDGANLVMSAANRALSEKGANPHKSFGQLLYEGLTWSANALKPLAISTVKGALLGGVGGPVGRAIGMGL